MRLLKTTKNNRQDVPEKCIKAELIASEQRHMPEGLSSKHGLISSLTPSPFFLTYPQFPSVTAPDDKVRKVFLCRLKL